MPTELALGSPENVTPEETYLYRQRALYKALSRFPRPKQAPVGNFMWMQPNTPPLRFDVPREHVAAVLKAQALCVRAQVPSLLHETLDQTPDEPRRVHMDMDGVELPPEHMARELRDFVQQDATACVCQGHSVCRYIRVYY